VKRFRCVTFGCRVNQYETQAIREQFLSRGYEEAREDSAADLIVVNSCTVTEAADHECLSVIRSLHREQPEARIVVTGCLIQQDAQLLQQLPGVRLLVGNGQKHRVAELVEELDGWQDPRIERELSRVYAPLAISSFEGHQKAFIKVQDGCDRACAFCKIPQVRGQARSRDLSDLLQEIRRVVDNGFQEVVLTGVALGLWGKEWNPPMTPADLITAVDRVPGRFRVRLSSLDPRDLDDRFLEALAGSSRLCRHLHLSLQSGSDAVLQRMNRGYTAEWYRGRVEAIRRFWPDLGLTTDLIPGFPGETPEQFEESLELIRRISFLKVHVFPYSRRRGTSAWFFKEFIPPVEIKRRAQRARGVAAEVSREFRRRFVGTAQEVLVEGDGAGYTSQFIKVEFPRAAERIKELVPVRITAMTPDGLSGEELPQ